MKKLFFITFLLVSSYNGFSQTDTVVNNTVNKTQTSTIKSSWNQFNSYILSKQYDKAIDSGVTLSKDFTANKKYKEAFSTCRNMDQVLSIKEKEEEAPDYNLRYKIAKERLRIFISIKYADESKALIGDLEEYANKLNSPSLKDDILLIKADYYHKFNMEDKSLECYKQLISKRTANKDVTETGKSYQDLINYAEQNNDASLAIAIKKLYSNWQDSIKVANESQKYDLLQKQYDTTQDELSSKEGAIKANIAIIVILSIISIALAVGILFILGMLFKSNRKNKKLSDSLLMANNNNNQKSKFISNINNQINPSLDKIEEEVTNLPVKNIVFENINALKRLTNDIHKFIEIEETKNELYPIKEFNVYNLCEKIMDKAKEDFKQGVDAELKVPKVQIRSNPEALEKVLSHLLHNASKYTETGKISLEFKKRSAHSGQFMVTDSGCSIPLEKRKGLFKPFAQAHDITKGSGLGLPICAVMALKLKGNIHLDYEHKHGTRFILELHS